MTETLLHDERVAAATDHAPLLERAFAFRSEEGSYAVDDVEGEVPAFVRGAYYVNGPGLFSRGDERYRNWLDGDGMVSSLRFAEGGVHFTNRFVRSDKFVAEEESGRFLFRAFGTAFADDRLKHGIGLESPVNVSVYSFGDAVLAFGEQGLPWELDPVTLETRGPYTFGRRLNTVSPFSAHPHFDPHDGEAFNFGVSFSARQPSLNLYRFAADGELVYRRRLALERPSSVHDFMLAPRHVVFYVSPYVLDMEALTGGGSTLMDALVWRPEEGSTLLVARREDGAEAARIPIGDRYCLHLVNAFEADGLLHVDVVELDRPVYDQYEVPDLFPAVRTSRAVRYSVDVAAAEVIARRELRDERMCDFPAIDPRLAQRPYEDFWVLAISATARPGRKFFDQVARFDWRRGGVDDVWQAPRHVYLGGEPVFLPDPASADGAVLCQAFDAAREESSYLVFAARDLAAGPVARLRLRSPVHLGFHASFHPDPRPAEGP